LSLTLTEADFGPPEVGEKVTLTAQVLPAANVDPQV
jgi:hypothetical protein